jgi:type IV pilus assembly protein PilB
MRTNDSFLTSVVARGLVTPTELDRLLAQRHGDAAAVLMDLAVRPQVDRTVLGQLWGDSIGCAFVDLNKTLIQAAALRRVPAAVAAMQRVVPLYQFGDRLTVAAVDPTNRTLLQEVSRAAGVPVSAVFTFGEDIDAAIQIHYQSQSSLGEMVAKLPALFRTNGTVTDDQLKRASGEQGMVEFVKGLLLLAVKERATDIHIDPAETEVRIRFRVDGVLHDRFTLDVGLLPQLTSRLKVLAGMNIAEKRRPQDGRISFKLGSRSVELRASVVPAIYGEKTVLRVLTQAQFKGVPELDDLELSAAHKDTVLDVAGTPNGVFFVTGPTGSGKTTTLFSVLRHLNHAGRNIMTIEDPVEYRLAGVNQIQVNHAIDLDFSTALRSFLRQDPDVILVGEIRDSETAKIAAQAALTGHLVLATMHTNNALQAVTRLVEIGVEPFLVAPSIIGVMAQRLVRKVCEHCKAPYPAPPEILERLFDWDGHTEVTFYRGEGCEDCNHTGFLGRIAIHEVFIINDEMRGLIARNASILDVQDCAHRHGFRTMHYDGVKKALRGLTTIDEIELAVTHAA